MNLSVNNKQNKNNIVLEKNKKLERVNQNKITYNSNIHASFFLQTRQNLRFLSGNGAKGASLSCAFCTIDLYV